MGQWADGVARGEADVAELLGSVPGEMCPRIDGWQGRSRWARHVSGLTTLGRESQYDEVSPLYTDAEAIRDERDAAVDGLEECRTALDALRSALLRMTSAYRYERDRANQLAEDYATLSRKVAS